MDKFQERELKSFLSDMMPADYKFPNFWKHIVDSVIDVDAWRRFAANPKDEREKKMFLDFNERDTDRVVKEIGEELFNQMLAEIKRFRIQCMEYYPNDSIADKELIPYTVYHDGDGFIVPETKHHVVYHLKDTWRGFKAGQSIIYHDGERGVGGHISAHWSLYFPPKPEEEEEDDTDEVETEKVVTKPKPVKQTTTDDDDGYW